MRVYTIQTPDGRKLKIEAADEATALRGAQEFAANNPAGQAQAPATSPQAPPQSFGDQLSAGFTSGVNALPFGGQILSGKNIDPGFAGLPLIGPLASGLSSMGGLEGLKAAVQGRSQQDVAASDLAQVDANPVASGVGAVAGTVAPFLVGGEIPAIAKILGMDASVPLLGRTLASLGSNAAISGGDALTRGASPEEAAKQAAIGGTIGAIIPGASDLVGKGLGALGKQASRAWDTLTNTDRAAQKVVAGTAANDVRAGNAMTPADEANAAINGQPIVNADRFGQGVRTLARTAANSNPSADAALKAITEDRFLTQGSRATDFVRRITGGAVDDLALQEGIKNAARSSNRAAYDRAYMAPNAQAVWTPEIRQLFQSPDFISAIRGAEHTAANDAALTGRKAVRSPFTFDAQGNIGLRQGAGGAVAIPNLQFWDIVQRNLRKAAEKAARSPDGLSDASTLGQLRTQLLTSLDSAVPAFKAARQGAAAAFGAEDALDAGRQFVTQKTAIPEAQRAHAKFSAAEKKAFGVGFASSLIDKIGAASDRVNVINQVFGSPAARAQVELALGKPAAMQLEHFVRIEDIQQMTKQAVQGNSSTAKQLAAMGAIGGLGGGFLGGWDPRNIATGAGLFMAGRMGTRALGKAVDQKVMQRVADILADADPAAINRTILNATLSPNHGAAIRAIEMGLQAITRGGALAAQQPRPVQQITVNGGNAPAY